MQQVLVFQSVLLSTRKIYSVLLQGKHVSQGQMKEDIIYEILNFKFG